MRIFAIPCLFVSLSACAGQAAPPASPCPACAAAPAAVTPTNASRARLDAIGQQRLDLARQRLTLVRGQWEKGGSSAKESLAASRAVAVAARDSGFRGETLRKVLAEHRELAMKARESVEGRYERGALTDAERLEYDGAVAEADYWLAEAEAAP